jgi:hypothetical protein
MHFVKKARETPLSLSSTGTELRRDREMLSSLTNGAPAPAPPAAVEAAPQRPPERVAAPARPSWIPAARAGTDGAPRTSPPLASATASRRANR